MLQLRANTPADLTEPRNLCMLHACVLTEPSAPCRQALLSPAPENAVNGWQPLSSVGRVEDFACLFWVLSGCTYVRLQRSLGGGAGDVGLRISCRECGCVWVRISALTGLVCTVDVGRTAHVRTMPCLSSNLQQPSDSVAFPPTQLHQLAGHVYMIPQGEVSVRSTVSAPWL